jgi:hypothetical protein
MRREVISRVAAFGVMAEERDLSWSAPRIMEGQPWTTALGSTQYCGASAPRSRFSRDNFLSIITSTVLEDDHR